MSLMMTLNFANSRTGELIACTLIDSDNDVGDAGNERRCQNDGRRGARSGGQTNHPNTPPSGSPPAVPVSQFQTRVEALVHNANNDHTDPYYDDIQNAAPQVALQMVTISGHVDRATCGNGHSNAVANGNTHAAVPSAPPASQLAHHAGSPRIRSPRGGNANNMLRGRPCNKPLPPIPVNANQCHHDGHRCRAFSQPTTDLPPRTSAGNHVHINNQSPINRPPAPNTWTIPRVNLQSGDRCLSKSVTCIVQATHVDSESTYENDGEGSDVYLTPLPTLGCSTGSSYEGAIGGTEDVYE